MPPPALHMRPGNEYYNQPTTPSQYGFTSPPQTPQGSPSKSQMPPGAHDLPNVFDNAMRLIPTTAGPPSNIGRLQPSSPTKSGIPIAEDNYAEFMDYSPAEATPGSPTRKSNKENTPPGARPSPKKEASYINQAAQSRQEAYKTRDEPKQTIQRGLSQEDIDKLQKPSIKRLANVTQLCE